MNINDAAGIGKILPIDKLLELLQKATGRIFKSYFDRKDIETKALEIKTLGLAAAEVKADELRILTSAMKEIQGEIGNIEYTDGKLQINSDGIAPSNIKQTTSIGLEERTRERFIYQQAKKQLNIESVTSIAADELKEEGEINNVEIDTEWINRYFNIVEDISSEELQILWGKILAGEIKRPQSFSLRTLELIKNLSKEEAELITRVGNFALGIAGSSTIFRGSENNYLKKYGISYFDVVLLVQIGIIQPGETTAFQYQKIEEKETSAILYGNLALVLEREAGDTGKSLPIYLYTKAGNEINKLLEIKPNLEYLADVANYLKGDKSRTKYGIVKSCLDNSVQVEGDYRDI
ncbi:MAG: DUF2806 domain-containing protein [Chitinophaga sp.]|uniref:DUF2806 domain-containing protein n=1 Tax=Chitinophaga sp. TaxID=1869181 RepID=UPI001AFCDA21|nr:DUF2806 domain-containing protein [Chitinophaga sp.]MBO9728408.1 DUF2806 domain-containing protein [Chitinophaga sp.]